MFRKTALILCFFFVVVSGYSQLIFNEVVAKNANSYQNTKGDSPDWIELKNISEQAVNLKDFSIATASGKKHNLPSVNLQSGRIYLLKTDDSETAKIPFPLSADAETLYLLNGGKVIDSVSWKNLPPDVSIGRLNGDNFTYYYFSQTTPRRANSTETFVAKTLDKPKLTVQGAVFETAQKFYVSAYSSDSKTALRYTLNGSTPTEKSDLFPDSLLISKTTNIRVKAFRSGYLPSKTTTESYIMLNRKQTLPIVSINVKHEDFFNYYTGIYMEGPYAEEEDPHFGANYWRDVERLVNFEYFTPDEGKVVSQEVGAKIAGNYSRAKRQKSLKFYARTEYGDNKIHYQFFKDKAIYDFHVILLRNSGNDFNYTQIRDGLISTLATNMNIDRLAYRPAVVYINGEYYGIQNVREKMSTSYIAENYNLPKSDIVYIRNWGENPTECDASSYWNMRSFIENTDLSIPENYATAKTLVDVESFINYNILEMYVVNEDWPGNNISYWHSISQNTPWRYILQDADFGFGIWDASKVEHNMLTYCTAENSDDYSNDPWATAVLRSFLKNANFRRDFLNRTADNLNTRLSTDSVCCVIDSIQNLIKDEIPYHIKRWDNMKDNVQNLKTFAQRRESIMRQHTEDFFETNGSYELQLAISDEKAGKIHLNSIDICRFPWSGKYFNNNTIQLTAIPREGYKFIGWTGSVTSAEALISVTTDQTTSLTANFEYVGNKTQIQFTEIFYHPINESQTEWFEIQNISENSVNVSNFVIRFDAYNQTFTIPEGTTLASGDFMVFTNNKELLLSQNTHANIVGNLDIEFPQNQAVIDILTPNGEKIASVFYSNKMPFVRKADGFGHSMERFENSWQAVNFGGTMGKQNEENEVSARLPLSITEVNFASANEIDAGDWFEIYNPNTEAVDMSGFMILDKGNNAIVFPENSPQFIIPSGEYMVFVKNAQKFKSIFPNVPYIELDFSLNNYVDGIWLYNKNENLEDSVQYSVFKSQAAKAAFESGRTLSLNVLHSESQWLASKTIGTPAKANDFMTNIRTTTNESIKAFPNPCNEFVNIQTQGDFSFEIVSPEGIILQQGKSHNFVEINLNTLKSGLYLLVVRANGKIECQNLVKK